jgi:dipicolinate synthase subunit B
MWLDQYDTRFGTAKDLKDLLKVITQKDPITTIIKAEPIGPQSYLDLLVIAPCTGNTLAKDNQRYYRYAGYNGI